MVRRVDEERPGRWKVVRKIGEGKREKVRRGVLGGGMVRRRKEMRRKLSPWLNSQSKKIWILVSLKRCP